MPNEIRIEFHEALEKVRDDVVRLGAMTVETIGKGTAALLDRDLDAAQRLIDGDDVIDVLTLDVEERCYQLLALQQPMAGDLRFVVSSLRIVSELERSADLMVNICKAARRIYDVAVDPKVRGLVEDMSLEAAALTRKAIDAYAQRDEGLAAALDDIDDRLDELQTSFVEAVFGTHETSGLTLRSAVQLALIGRYYERIGDHAVNIGERIGYMVTGWLPEHDAVARQVLRGRVEPASTPVVVELGDGSDDLEPPEPARLSAALDATRLAVVVTDADGAVEYRNRAARALFEASDHRVLVRDALEQALQRARRDGPTEREVDLFGPPASTFRIRVDPLPRPLGEAAGMVAVIEDVSEGRRLDRVRRDFVANVSHELKTPVGAVSLLAETLAGEAAAGGADPGMVLRLSSRMSREMARLTRTVEDLLELSRVESGDELELEQIRVGAVVEGTLDRLAAAAEARGIQLAVAGDLDLGVCVDVRQLTSALANLVDNALKYSPEGSEVRIEVTRSADEVRLTVADDGVGIPAGDLARVFERFYRVDPGRSRETGGTGLGLSIVRHIAANHGGSVEVESHEGAGSRFTLRLPVVEGPG